MTAFENGYASGASLAAKQNRMPPLADSGGVASKSGGDAPQRGHFRNLFCRKSLVRLTAGLGKNIEGMQTLADRHAAGMAIVDARIQIDWESLRAMQKCLR